MGPDDMVSRQSRSVIKPTVSLGNDTFTSKELDKHISSAHHEFERNLFVSIYNKLDEKTKLLMDELLSDDVESDGDEVNDDSEIKFKHLKIDIPGAKLKNISRAIQKIACLKQLDLPIDLLSSFSEKLIKKYYQRIMAERPSGMKEHALDTRYA